MFRVIKDYYPKYIKGIIADIICVAVQIYIQMIYITGESKRILEHGVYKSDMDFVMSSGARMLIFTGIMGVIIIFQSYFSGRVTAGVIRDIRNDCFRKITSLSPEDYAKFGASTLHTRTIVDPENIQTMSINLLRSSMMVPVLIIGISIIMLKTNLIMAITFLAIFALAIASFGFFSKKAQPSFLKLQNKIDRITLLISEKVTGVRPVRAFNNQKYEEDRLAQANEEARNEAIIANKHINFLAPVSMVIMNWAVVVVYLLGSNQLKHGMIQISDLLLYFTYVGYFIAALAVVPLWVNLIPKLTVSCARIFELLDYDGSDNDMHCGREAMECGDIEFRNVTFGFNTETPAIKNVSFTARAGKTTALIGTTGSGKSTILNLLTGLYSMQEGEIIIGGKDLNSIDREEMDKKIAYATQVVQIYQDSVFNNVSMYNKSYTEEQVQLGCDLAQFTEVLQDKNEGLDFMLTRGGSNLS